MCGDLLTCIPLFIESVFEVPLKKRKKRISINKKKEKKNKKKQGATLLRLIFPSVRSGAL
jgi:hypothetical protein